VRRALLLLALLTCGTAAPSPPPCRLHSGQRIVLYSSTGDPEVLVWDSRFRLRAYGAASFDEARQLLPHAYVVQPGTRAVVQTCVRNFVSSPPLGSADDAVGIKITSGSSRGRMGWVVGSDVRSDSKRW
jgi:hypothetical protein